MFRMAVETGFHRPMDRTPWELVDHLVLTFPRMLIGAMAVPMPDAL